MAVTPNLSVVGKFIPDSLGSSIGKGVVYGEYKGEVWEAEDDKKKRRHRCESCGQVKDDVIKVIDPYE